MEDLVKKQDEEGIAMQTLISNYKKAPFDRRTLDFYKSKLEELQGKWASLNQCDNLIRKNHGNEETHQYFIGQFFETISKVFCETQDSMLHSIKQLESVNRSKSPGPSGSNEQSVSYNKPSIVLGSSRVAKIKKQSAMIATVRNQLNQLLTDDAEHSYRHYAVHLKTVQQHWQTIQNLHNEIWDAMENVNSAIYDYEAFIKTEAEVNNQMALLEDKAQVPRVTNTPSQQSSDTKLPRIKLPQFDGNYLKWRQFRDLFIEMVDRQCIPRCQKMWYLKTSLTGEAESLVKHFTATDSNYEAAWKVVTDRYENLHLLVNAVLTRFLAQPQIIVDNSAAIKALHDTTHECLLSLNCLGVDTKSWDLMLMILVVQRLPKTSHALLEQSLSDPKQLPSLDDFLHFLLTRFQSLEALSSRPVKECSEQTKNRTYRALSVSIQSRKNCIVCKQDHPVYRCPTFEKMTPSQRLAIIQKNKHCVNCLKNGHNAKTCTSGVCSKCQKKHNTMLHLDSSQGASGSNNSHVVDDQQASSSAAIAPNSIAAVQSCTKSRATALLSTICLSITNQQGESIKCRAVLDNGSQANFISSQLVTKLGLPKRSCHMGIEGIGQMQGRISERVNVKFHPIKEALLSALRHTFCLR